MIAILGNIKGGVGKSTLSLILANYLTQEHKRSVMLLDADDKQSLVSLSEKSKILETPSQYTIYPKNFMQHNTLLEQINKEPKKILIVDLPSHLNDNILIPYLKAAEIFLCPFHYDEFTIPSTISFALLVAKINPRAVLLFIPNRIKRNIYIENKNDIEAVLANFGIICPIIYDRIDFQRVSNIHTPSGLLSNIMPILDNIYALYFSK